MRYIIRFAWVFSFIIIIFSVFDLNFNTQSAVSGIVEARGQINYLQTLFIAFLIIFLNLSKPEILDTLPILLVFYDYN